MPRRLTLKISKTAKGGKPLYLIYCPARLSPDGKARVYSFRKRADADTHRGKLFAAWQNLQPTPLSPTETADAQSALRALADAGIKLSLTAAIQAALPLLSRSRTLTVEQLVTEYIDLKSATWRPLSARNFRSAARRLVESFGDKDAAELSTADLSKWLISTFPATTSQAHAVRTLNGLFSYAVRQKLIAENPFALMERHKAKKEEAIDVLTPAEARSLMEASPADCIPAYALLLFAGVRPKELARLKWGNVRDGFIHVTPDIAKTRHVRNIDINPTLAAWLTAYRPADATSYTPIAPTNWKRKDQSARAAAGIANRPDVCRHSYATYYLASYGSVDALKNNMGHSRSSETLFVHYRAAATPEQAEQFWRIRPEKAAAKSANG